jgi:hypothetical protein
MFRATRCFAALAVLSLAAAPLTAQPVQAGRPILANCLDNLTAPGAYGHCALSLTHTRLVRAGVMLDRMTFLHHAALGQYVTGDSALRYARAYETETRRSTRIALLGTGLLVSAFVAGHACPAHVCSQPNRRSLATAEIVGGSLFVISLPIKIHGRNQGYKAVDFYNASLGH